MAPPLDPAAISAARVAIAASQFPAALAIADTILAGDPANLDALEVRAIAQTRLGDIPNAERTLRLAIAAAPKRRWPYADLARLLLAQNRRDDAEAVARKAIEADADNPDARALLATLLAQRGELVPAIAHFRCAIAVAGPHPDLTAALGHALMRQGDFEAARPLLQSAMGANPKALPPIAHLAELEERAGHFDLAEHHLDRAERLAAATGRDVILQRATLLTRQGRWHHALALLEAQPTLSPSALLHRGRLRDRAGRHTEAWTDWTAAKSRLAAASARTYPAADLIRQAAALARFCGVSARPAPTRSNVPQPIFILGFPRSGTTLTEQILGSHKRIRPGGELPFGRDLREAAATSAGGEASFPSGLADAPDWTVHLRDLYFEKAASYALTAPGADFFTDKMPLNDMWLPLLRRAFPSAPVVLVRRDPRDVLVSVMSHDMTHGYNCAYRLEDAARHLALIDRLIESYREAGITITHELRYESLVADQRGETKRMMDAIRLEIEPAQLRFHESRRITPTPSYAQVQEPLNDRAIGRWRAYSLELAPVMPIIAEAIERGGYAA